MLELMSRPSTNCVGTLPGDTFRSQTTIKYQKRSFETSNLVSGGSTTLKKHQLVERGNINVGLGTDVNLESMFEEMKQGIGIFKAGQIPDMGMKLKS